MVTPGFPGVRDNPRLRMKYSTDIELDFSQRFPKGERPGLRLSNLLCMEVVNTYLPTYPVSLPCPQAGSWLLVLVPAGKALSRFLLHHAGAYLPTRIATPRSAASGSCTGPAERERHRWVRRTAYPVRRRFKLIPSASRLGPRLS